MASAALGLRVVFSLRVEVVVFPTAVARDFIRVRSDDHATLALGEEAHVDPDLLAVAIAKVAVVHVRLVADFRAFFSLCLRADYQLPPKAVVAALNAFKRLHSIFNELEARGALIRDQWLLEWPHAFAFRAPHFAFFLEDEERLWRVIAEKARLDGDVRDALRTEARRALTAELVTIRLHVEVCQLVAVLAPLLFVGAPGLASLALRNPAALQVGPVGHLLARDAKVGILFGQLPAG